MGLQTILIGLLRLYDAIRKVAAFSNANEVFICNCIGAIILKFMMYLCHSHLFLIDDLL